MTNIEKSNIYINLETGEYPCFQGDVRLIHPEMGEEFELPPCFAEIIKTDMPVSDDADYKIVEDLPKQIDNNWHQQWHAVELTEKEKLMRDTKPNNDEIYIWIDEESKWVTEIEYTKRVADSLTMRNE